MEEYTELMTGESALSKRDQLFLQPKVTLFFKLEKKSVNKHCKTTDCELN